jgi:predicted small lipoprotein YifL
VDRTILGRIAIAGLLVAAVALAGCGRKGALEAPPGATLQSAAPEETAPADATAIPKPDKPFILDGLLH